jgi:microcystin-dependent protein
MSDPFVAEIRIFAGNFNPTGWALCNGQLIPISQNTALFALLGTYYGGDGKSTFALPNLMGSVPIFWGQGQGLTDRILGEQGGDETVTLIQSEMPFHTHLVQGVEDRGNQATPINNALSQPVGASTYKSPAGVTTTPMAAQALSITGSSLPHNNLMPYLTLTFIIALQGVFPPRS